MQRLLFAATLSLIAAPSLAEGPALWIADPRGCAPYAGVGGDGGPFLVMTEETSWLDYELFETPRMSCRFDAPMHLVAVAGESEERIATCEYRDGTFKGHGVELVYESATEASLNITYHTIPLYFELCPLD